jgi:hypothetical protein
LRIPPSDENLFAKRAFANNVSEILGDWRIEELLQGARVDGRGCA